MEQQREPAAEEIEAGRKGGMAAAVVGAPVVPGTATAAAVGEAVYLGLSRAGWSAIWAGFLVGATTSLVLNTLGAALGIAWLRADTVTRGEALTAAATWVLATSLISLFVGGYTAGRLHGLPGRATGAVNGFLYGCLHFLLLIALSLTPVTANMPSVAWFWAQIGGPPTGAPPTPAQAQALAWWAFFGIVLSLAVATLGGMAGARQAAIEPLTTGEPGRTRAPVS